MLRSLAAILIISILTFGCDKKPQSAEDTNISTGKPPSQETLTSNPDYVQLAASLGISSEEINNSAQICNNAIANVAGYIKDRVPLVATVNDGILQLNNDELDRNKLDDAVIRPQTEIIYSELIKTSERMKSFTEELSSVQAADSIKRQIQDYITSRYMDIVAAYFTCAILEYSIPMANEYYLDGTLPEPIVEKVEQLEKQQYISAWFQNNRYSVAYDNLLDIISSINTTSDRISELSSKLDLLDKQLKEGEQNLGVIETQLNYYENHKMVSQYDTLFSSYKEQASSLESFLIKYNELVNQRNSAEKKRFSADLKGAFDGCINPKILFADYDNIEQKENIGR
jgi:hypothetical protein